MKSINLQNYKIWRRYNAKLAVWGKPVIRQPIVLGALGAVFMVLPAVIQSSYAEQSQAQNGLTQNGLMQNGRTKQNGFVRLAQAASAKAGQSLQVGKVIVAKPGETVAVPVKTKSSAPIASTSHVIIDGAPSWLKLTKGEAVGDGVWLLRASELANLQMKLPATAKGEHEMNVLLVDKDGKIVSEAQMALNVQTGAAGGAGGAGGKTWQSLLGGGGVAPGAAVPQPRKIVKKPNPPAAKAKQSATSKMNDKQKRDYAKYLVRECTTCHSLFGDDSGIPVMIGIKVDRFVDTMQLYRDGKRDNLAMINVARSLDDGQIDALANYLGGVRPAAKIKQARATAANNGSILGGGAAPGAAVASRPVARTSSGRIAQPSLTLSKRKITPTKLKRADRWVAKGRALLKAGRVAQARLWFKRAAEYGVAQAAMLLGSSFDPNFLISRSGSGLIPDAGQAKNWYQYARQLGSQVAGQRLANLPAG